MIPMLFPFFADTVIAPPECETIHVHEWGVVRFEERGTDVVGIPWADFYAEPIDNLIEPIEVEAPVVWFHGPAFTGTFRVRTENGWLTELYPQPDFAETLPAFGIFPERSVMARWTDLQAGGESLGIEKLGEQAARISYEWAMDYWREVPACYLFRRTDGFCDRFIYYECTIVDDIPSPLVWNNGDLSFDPGYTGEGLLFIPNGEFTEIYLIELEGSPGLPEVEEIQIYDPDYVKQVICEWAGGGFKSSEIDALWKTWENTLTTGCDDEGSWLLFPLPSETVEAISTIELKPDGFWHEVQYERLFLGLVKVGF